MHDQIEEAFLERRRVFLSREVDSQSAQDLVRKLWYLEWKNPGKPIFFFINSPGGSVDSGFAIWDTVQMITSPVTTVVSGLAASMGSLLSLCASEGRRYATPNSRIMMHQPLIGGQIQGQATDLEIHAEQIENTRKQIVQMYAKSTGRSAQEIDDMIERDHWMSAEEALSFGLLDKVISSSSELCA
ncbi:MAG: ATP-dependent Clp protease proteolytic subunit [Chlamydiota bacterium]